MMTNIGLPGLLLLGYLALVLGFSLHAAIKAPESDGRFVYAGFWNRVIAAFLDGLVTVVLVFVSAFIGGALFGIASITSGMADATDPTFEANAQVIGNIIGIVVAWLYFACSESSSHQATLGKRALGLNVVDADGNRIGFGRATGRHFAKYISMMTVLIGYFMIGWTPRKQGLHDIIGGCLVVKRDAVPVPVVLYAAPRAQGNPDLQQAHILKKG